MLRKNKPHKQLLVSLADENYVDYARQLFSSAYWKGGWEGDYMLLAYKVPEEKLKWFTDKGILVKICDEINTPIFKSSNFSEVVLNKFLIFTEEFKQWDNILFLDIDIIIRYDINKLGKVKGFNAVKEKFPLNPIKNPIGEVTEERQKIFNKIIEKYGTDSVAMFNSGVMAFSTDIIKPNTFKEILDISNKYHEAINFGEQPIVSIYFGKHFKNLPKYYNYFTFEFNNYYQVDYSLMNGIILHTIDKHKPWYIKSDFYSEWSENLDSFSNIKSVENINKLVKNFNLLMKINFQAKYFMFDKYRYIDRKIGQLGILLRRIIAITTRIYHKIMRHEYK